MYLNNLGNGLSDRYARTGRVADLDRALALFEDAMSHTESGSPEHAASLHRVGEAYLMRYLRLNNIKDLIGADLTCAYSVQLTPIDAPTRPARVGTLAQVRKARYDKFHSSDDLQSAIAMLEENLRGWPGDSPNRRVTLQRLGNCYEARFRSGGAPGDLDLAIQTYESVLQLAPTTAAAQAQARLLLGRSLFTRFLIARRNEADVRRAWRLGQDVWQSAHEGDMQTALLAARLLARVGAFLGQWDEVIRVASTAADLSRQLMEADAFVEERIRWLRETQGVAALAAYAKAKGGDSEGAVVELERGLAQFFNGALGDLRRDRLLRQRLRDERPEFHAKLDAANDQWRAYYAKEPTSAGLESERMDEADERRQRATAAWRNLVATIAELNALPGYETYLAPPALADIAEAATAARPLVYLTTTLIGSLVLVIHRLPGQVRVEPLWAELTEFDLDRVLIRRASDEGNVGPAVGGLLAAQEMSAAEMSAALSAAQAVIGERLIGPLAARLRELGAQQVTLIPGGQLRLLPLHVASYVVDGRRRAFLDEFEVIYAPSAQAAILTGERAARHEPGLAPALVVGNPLPMPPPHPPLPHAAMEARIVASLVAGEVTPLLEADATPPAVWNAMVDKRLIHFACHAVFNPRFPNRSGVVLADGKGLGINSINDYPLSGTRLVVMSACQTALTDFRDLPDEVTGLPASFLVAGAAGIVGSLWPVDSRSTTALMADFYRRLAAGVAPAAALRAAQRWLRAVTWGELDALYADLLARVPAAEAAQAEAAAHDPHETPYADPYHWAAFAFYGG
jgi:CHAT domain-containing protein